MRRQRTSQKKVVDFFEKTDPDFIATNDLGIYPDATYFKAEEEDEDKGSMVEDDEES